MVKAMSESQQEHELGPNGFRVQYLVWEISELSGSHGQTNIFELLPNSVEISHDIRAVQ